MSEQAELNKLSCGQDDGFIDGCSECVSNLTDEFVRLSAEIERLQARNELLETVVSEQAGDQGLWFFAKYATEAYLQNALRELHEAVEGKTREQCARDAIAAIQTGDGT